MRRKSMMLCGRVALAIACVGVMSALGASSAAAACSNEALRQQQGAEFLSACRAYEMVSPPQKGGSNVFRIQSEALSSGGSLLFSSSASFGDSPSASRVNFYRADRGVAGWGTGSESAPLGEKLLPPNSALKGIADDFSAAVVETTAELAGVPTAPFVPTLYRKDASGYQLLISNLPEGFEGIFYEPNFVAGSSGYEHVLFTAPVPQTPDAPAGVGNLYEWEDGQVRLVNVLPDAECEELSLSPGCAAPGGGGDAAIAGQASERRHVISADGSRIFFAAGGNLYLRENGTTSRQIGPDGSLFQQATPDGSKVLYKAATDLFQYDVETEVSTPIDAGGDGGVVGQSEDGDRVYLVSTNVHASGAEAGDYNLYLFENGSYDFVAALNGSSSTDDPKAWSYATMADRAVSPDGGFLVFRTVESPTGYDNSNPSCVFERCDEYHRYAAEDASLVCVSCNASGAPPSGPASTQWVEVGITVSLREAAPRYLSADGSRVFFNSPDPLVGRDSNGITDVYVWEEGSGAQLLSTGRSEQVSVLLGSGASGEDAFIWTTERLVGIDRDRVGDAYDVKVGGGFAAQMPPPPAAPCVGEGCRAPLAPPPPPPSAGSAALQGPPNTKPKRKKQQKKQTKKKGKGSKQKGKAGKSKGGNR